MPDPDLPSRVTMPLLTRITQQSLDEDYRVAAERRSSISPGPRRAPTGRWAVAVIAVFGVLIATAFVQNRRGEDVESAGRDALIDRITSQRERVNTLHGDIAELRERNAALGERLTELNEEEAASAARLQRLETVTGFVAVTGPGVRMVVDNAEGAGVGQLLRDEDLALLANGLWSAGAEAISINGQRLTALGAIRTSGVPIEVNGVGIAAPYTLLAIGDSRTMQANFIDSSSGVSFDQLQDSYGFELDMENVDDLSLPSAPERLLRLRSATSGTSDDPVSPKNGGTPP